MNELKKYLIFQIEHLEKIDKKKSLSDYGEGKLSSFKDVLKQLFLQDSTKRNWFEKLPIYYRLLIYYVSGIITGVLILYFWR